MINFYKILTFFVQLCYFLFDMEYVPKCIGFLLYMAIKCVFVSKYSKIVLFNYNFFRLIEVKVNNMLKMMFFTIFKKYGTIN
jgi:hypothetical protein